MLSELITKSIIGSIYSAVYKNDLAALTDAKQKYQRQQYSAEELARHKKCFSRLLTRTILRQQNAFALELVALGADLNYYGPVALSTPTSGYFQSVALPKYGVDVYPHQFETPVTPTVHCYVLDVIVFANNYDLLRKIGISKFDLQIYQVAEFQHQNILNPKVNPSDYRVTNCYANPAARRRARDKFKHDLIMRMLWCSMFCNFALQHERVDLIQMLQTRVQMANNSLATSFRHQVLNIVCRDRLYELACCTPYRTSKITHMYLQAAQGSLAPNQLRIQELADQWLNFPLSVLFSHVYMARAIEIDCLRMLNTSDPSSQEILTTYKYFYAQMYSLGRVMLTLLPYAGFAFWFAYTKQDGSVEDFALLACTSMIFAFAAFNIARLLLALSLRAASGWQLEALGSMDTIALRVYNSKMLWTYQDHLNRAPASPQTTRRCCLP